MDTQSKDVLEQLLERLDKLDSQQYKLDRVLERLDTLQNVQEIQNKKQNQLNEKLEQEKIVATEQLRAAQEETVKLRGVIDSQGESTLFQHKITQQQEVWCRQIADQLKTIVDYTQQQEVWCRQIADQLKTIDGRTADTARKYDQLITLSRKTEDKLTELADNNKVIIKTFLVEIRSVKDLVKGQTNSELIWLNSQTDKKLSDIGSVVTEIYQQQRKEQEERVRSPEQMLWTAIQPDKQVHTQPLNDKPNVSKEIVDKQMQVILDLERQIQQHNLSVLHVPYEIKTTLDAVLTANKQFITDLDSTLRYLIVETIVNNKDQLPSADATTISDVNKLLETVQSELQKHTSVVITDSEKQTNKIINAAKSANAELGHLIQTQENSDELINALEDRIQKDIATIVTEVESTKASMVNGHAAMNNSLEILATALKDYIYTTKRELFAVIEKEAQIVRDRIKGPVVSPGKYTFDFYVNDFKTLVRSGKVVESLPWHIIELQTCVTGAVKMSTNGEMVVMLLEGRRHREVGLQPRPGKILKIKATICDINKKLLPSIQVDETTGYFSEADNDTNGSMGSKVGVTSCDLLLRRGYGSKEEYENGAILIRYEVSLLK